MAVNSSHTISCIFCLIRRAGIIPTYLSAFRCQRPILIIFQPPFMQHLNPNGDQVWCFPVPAVLFSLGQLMSTICECCKLGDSGNRCLWPFIIVCAYALPAARGEFHGL